MDLINVIQEKVDQIAKEKYKNDECHPIFLVSVLQEQNEEDKIYNHKILLTIKHKWIQHSRVIFPVLSCQYGYETLENEMKSLYNSTM